ncbi:MAG TPA: META domain-containing protein [Pyrinomonadaceae bacterium]
MIRKYFNTGLNLLIVVGLLSAAALAQGSRRNDLGAKRWQLTELNGARVSGSKAFLEIEPSLDRVNGNAGCNRMFGGVSVSGRNINFSGIGTTRMACAERGAMKLEADFTRALERVTRFERTGNNLNLYARNRLVLKFRGADKKEPEDDSAARLENRKWVLESIKNRRLPRLETAPFINFDKTKGSAGGDTGCNAFGGNYSTTRDAIAVTNIVSTMRACIEDERMNVEREFKNALENANRFEIAAGKLNLYRNRDLLLTFRAENE